jgi:hypothetical protein
MRHLVGALVLLAAVTPSLASADPASDVPATEVSVPVADTLYQRAKELMASGRYAEACADFAESNRLDPATGGTLLNLAVCHEKLGKIATACAEFEQARSLARYYRRPDREEFAAQHAALLRPRISNLSLAVHDPTDDEKILVDGMALSKVAWPLVPVDPGPHEVSAAAAGKQGWKTQVTVGEQRAVLTIDVPALLDVVSAEPATPPLVVAPRSASTEARSNGSGQRVAGYALGGLGIAALGVGAAFGISALEENTTSEQHCPGGRCDGVGASDSHSALTAANVANVCIGAGIVAVGVATVLILTAPRAKKPVLSMGALGLGGRW